MPAVRLAGKIRSVKSGGGGMESKGGSRKKARKEEGNSLFGRGENTKGRCRNGTARGRREVRSAERKR